MPRFFADSVSGAMPQAAAFQALVSLAVSLRGSGVVHDELDRLRDLCRAEREMIVRVEDARHRYVAVADRDAGRLFSERRPPCLAPDLLGAVSLALMPGKVLFLSALLEDGDTQAASTARDAFERTGLREVAVVVLEARGTGYDVVEFHFSGSTAAVEPLLACMGPALSACWSARLPGTARALAERARLRPLASAAPADGDLLSPENPAGLSRSEFRICALLREGMPTKTIARDLAIRPTTLRAHLQSIYAKTGAGGQVELVHRLARNGAPAMRDPLQLARRLA